MLYIAPLNLWLVIFSFKPDQNPPWERSSRSTGCASPQDTVGLWCPGCGSQWQLMELRTLSSGWRTVWCLPLLQASWEEEPSLTTSRTCHFCWHSNKGLQDCSTGRAWCWTAGDRSRPNLKTTNKLYFEKTGMTCWLICHISYANSL